MKFFYQFFFFLVSLSLFAQQNQLWKGYYSYNETTAVTKDHQNVYIATSNSVVAYNEFSKESEIYNTLNGLKIDGIQSLAYSADYKKIILGSKNGKIAIIDLATDKIYHLYDLFTKTNIPDNLKSINKISTHAGYAYLATGYGITAIRLTDNHFGDTFYIGANGDNTNVKSITINDNFIYAATTNGLKKASINTNLIDYNNWELLDFSNWLDITTYNNTVIGVKEDLSLNTISGTNQIQKIDDVWGGFIKLNVAGDILIEITKEAVRLRSQSLTVYNELVYSFTDKGGINDGLIFNQSFYLATVKNGGIKVNVSDKTNQENFTPSGPLSNNVFSLTLNNNDIWFTFGGYGNEMNPYNPDGLTEYGISNYKNSQTWNHYSFNDIGSMKATTNVSINSRKPNLLYISSFQNGLGIYDLSNNSMQIYNETNTNVLQPVLPNDVRVNGVTFDSNGLGWMTNSGVNPILASIDENKQFQARTINTFTGSSEDSYLKPIIDKNNTKWIGSRIGGLIAYNENRGNKSTVIRTSEGLSSNTINTVALDYSNKLWIGTSKGLRVINNIDQFLTQTELKANPVIFSFEGKAQELFFEQNILALTVDGSNNKWVSVSESGVFLINDKNYETIFNFTKENSPLPSNDVLDIKIDGATGEVLFVTRQGVVSFKNFATTPSGTLDEIKVFPNPVKPNFTGDVKISGLTSEATIKITDIAGNLVFETKSLGGTVNWNTFNFSGTKVASGVYMVFITSDDGTLDTVKKIMIIR